MSKRLGKSDSKKGQEIWKGVSKAAKNAPSWVKPRVQEAASASAHRIVDQDRTKQVAR